MSTLQTVSSPVVTREKWLVARAELKAREDAAAQVLAEVDRARRALPVVAVEKQYVLTGAHGRTTLLEAFEGRGQLITYHFMFDPTWDVGCRFCSYLVDSIGDRAHLSARDTTLVLVSRAPYDRIAAFRERMGWDVPWYSSYDSDFNRDFHVTQDGSAAPFANLDEKREALQAMGMPWPAEGEQGGLSVFVQQDGAVFHTYSTYGEGVAPLHIVDNYLEFTPQGRPQMEEKVRWLRHHDRYTGQT